MAMPLIAPRDSSMRRLRMADQAGLFRKDTQENRDATVIPFPFHRVTQDSVSYSSLSKHMCGSGTIPRESEHNASSSMLNSFSEQHPFQPKRACGRARRETPNFLSVRDTVYGTHSVVSRSGVSHSAEAYSRPYSVSSFDKKSASHTRGEQSHADNASVHRAYACYEFLKAHRTSCVRICVWAMVCVIGAVMGSFVGGSYTGPTQNYTVQAHDSLWNVAQQLQLDEPVDTTVATIMELNDMTNSEIQAGQEIIIPVTDAH